MKLSKYDLVALSILFLLVGIFFLPLYYPTSQLYVTPGYTKSDILHFNYPVKELLSKSLNNNTLPIWTDLIGTGFPVIAESQVQAFSLLNILLFKFFSVLIAFNLGYIISFLLLALGMYAVARNEGYSPVVAFITGFIFTFSGAHMVRIHHYNILLGSVYVPFIFLCCRRIMKNTNSHAWLFLPFFISQYILSTHLPSVFVTLLFFLFLIIASLYKRLMSLSKTMITKGIIVLLLSIGLASIQLLPTYEYFLNSNRESSVSLFNTSHSGLSLDNIIQFISPYSLGDIRSGTYSSQVNRPNFWEAFSYIGLIPFLLALFSLKNIRSKNKNIVVYWLTIGILFLLALEGNAPWYLLYSLPPFSFFRIYSRLIYPISFLLVLLFGYSLQEISSTIRKHKTILFTVMSGVILLSMIDVWHFASSYNPSDNVSEILQTPQTARYLSEHKPGRVYSLDSETLWRPIFTSYGWKDINRYKYAINMLNPNVNMLYNVPNIDVYAGFFLQKQLFVNSLIRSDVDRDSQASTASLSATGINMLRLTGTNYVITPYVLTNPELNRVFDVKSPYKDLGDIYIYNLPTAMHRYYIAYKIASVSGMRETAVNLYDTAWGQKYDAIINDGDRRLISNGRPNTNIEVKAYSDTKKIFYYKTDNDGYFLLLTYFYPGWTATIDGHKTNIYNANISSMAVFAPKGNHLLEFTYIPYSLYIGGLISIVSFIIYLFIIIKSVYRRQT